MNKISFLLLGLLLITTSQAQTLQQAEYFFDTDPGFGQGIPMTFGPTDSLSLDNLILANPGLSLGYHYLYLRAQDSDGVWGFTQRKRLYIYDYIPEPQPTSPLVAGEYFFDQDPGAGSGTPFTFSATDSLILSIQAQTPNLSLGTHTLYVRVRDSLGVWGFPSQRDFVVCNTFSPLAGFNYVQYGAIFSFIDTSQHADVYLWDFGDGSQDSVSNPRHPYASPGIYEVKQFVQNDCGIDSMTTTVIHGGIENYSPKVAGDTGWITLSFYGGFQDADSVIVKLGRAGQADIFAIDSTIKLVDNSYIQASFQLNYEEHGFWDISLTLVNDTTYDIPNGLEIEGVHLDYNVEILAPPNGFRAFTDNRIFVSFTNLSNVNLQYPHVSFISHNTDFIGNTKLALDDSLRAINLAFAGADNPSIVPNQTLTHSFYTRTTFAGLELGIVKPDPSMFFRSLKELACKIWTGGTCNCVPDLIFTPSCKTHDLCYAGCGNSQAKCDLAFLSDMLRQCSLLPYPFKASCLINAAAYYGGVVIWGEENYLKAQADNCPPPPPPFRDFGNNCIDNLPGFECDQIPGRGSADPNDKVGNQGYGSAHYIKGTKLNYGIRFENVDSATAPAAVVVILDTLDKKLLDLESFSLGSFVIGDSLFTVPPDRKRYTVDIDLADSLNLILRVNAYLNDRTGIVRWEFLSLDPLNKEIITDLRGFLPPNVLSPEGEGMVTFSIDRKKNLPSDTELKNRASIIFDNNEPIITNYWNNTLDLIPPSSSVISLPPTITQADLLHDSLLIINWSGTDQGSGIIAYDVFLARDDDTTFTKWQNRTIKTSDTLIVKSGERLRFYSIAYDGVGNVEPLGDTVETLIEIATRIFDKTLGNDVNIYPNPSHDFIYLEASIPNPFNLEVKITSIMGQEVYTYMFYPNIEGKYSEEMDISKLEPGIYLMHLKTEHGGEISQKFIKQ